MAFNGVLQQLRIRLQPQSFHDAVLVEGDGSRFQIQNMGDFLHRLALRQQLQDLPLAGGDSLFAIVDLAASQQKVDGVLRDHGR